jgi:hypothetical protein
MDSEILGVVNVRTAVSGHETPKEQVSNILHGRQCEDRLWLREERVEG